MVWSFSWFFTLIIYQYVIMFKLTMVLSISVYYVIKIELYLLQNFSFGFGTMQKYCDCGALAKAYAFLNWSSNL